MVKLCTLASGSSGNAVLVEAGGAKLLVDCGVSGATATRAMETIGVAPEELHAILVTHEHCDHIRGVAVMGRRYHLPIFATKGTWTAMLPSIGKVSDDQIRFITKDEPFSIRDAVISPFGTSHDAAESVGFLVSENDRHAAIATDLGTVDRTLYDVIAKAQVLLLEANHDVDMLRRGTYPPQLKARILSERGHLSNSFCGALAARLMESGEKQILLGHLSDENNTPDTAYRTVAQRLVQAGARIGRDVQLSVAPRYQASCLLEA